MELAEPDPRIGSVVDARYRILDCVAAGSMGVVYRAERVPVGRAVAIKFLHAAFAQDPEFVGRFERETRVMSKLTHPHCVSVLDFGVTDGAPYLVMDFVAGTTLWEILDEGAVIEVPRALALMRQMLAGLAHAHEQGIVHRDIKPANLMISEEIGTGPHIRILDFGLARLRGALSAHSTQSYVVVGTPSYMAPEQTVGNTVDARADIYSAGVVLFEMVTGEKPFRAEDTLALLGMHRGAPIPRLANLAPPGTEIPEGLQEVVDRAMAKDPADRYQTAIEFAAAVDEVAAQLPVAPGQLRRATSLPPRPSSDRPAVREPEVDSAIAPIPRRGGGALGFAILLMMLVGAAAATIWYLKKHDTDGDPSAADGSGTSPLVAAGSTAPLADAGAGAAIPPSPVDAGAAALAVTDAAVAPLAAAPLTDAALLTGVPLFLDGGAAPPPDAVMGDAGAAAPIDPAAIQLEGEPDPATVQSPDPAAAAAGVEAEAISDEAPDSPGDVPESEVPAPEPAKEPLAKTVDEAAKMMEQGKRELALASLLALWPKQKNSAYIPFLLGNIYYAKRWWSVSMQHYRTAINKNSAYKKNSTLNKNVIRMLASSKTREKANWFLRKTIGRPAKPYLSYCSKHDSNSTVKKRCAALYKVIR